MPSRRRPRPRKLEWGHDYDAFRRRLIEARESAHLTQRQAAERLGQPQSFVAQSETGERRVDVVELSRFARLYGRPLAWFFPD